MCEDVKVAKILKQKLLDFQKTNERESREQFEQSVHVTGAENLSEEIGLRISSLKNK